LFFSLPSFSLLLNRCCLSESLTHSSPDKCRKGEPALPVMERERIAHQSVRPGSYSEKASDKAPFRQCWKQQRPAHRWRSVFKENLWWIRYTVEKVNCLSATLIKRSSGSVAVMTAKFWRLTTRLIYPVVRLRADRTTGNKEWGWCALDDQHLELYLWTRSRVSVLLHVFPKTGVADTCSS